MYRGVVLGFFSIFLSCSSPNQIKADLVKDSASISIESFGAVPNDGRDDGKAIQAAIDHAFCNEISRITAGPGVFDLYEQIVCVKQCTRDKMEFVTFSLEGHTPVYDAAQQLGKTTVFKIHHDGFGVAVQKARNCQIRNVVFQGNYQGARDIESILKQGPGLPANKTHRPSCAIAIDPFHRNTPRDKRYDECVQWYTYNSNAGSSMLTISHCAFIDLEVAIANNPSLGVNNGDNIRVEDSHVKRCHTFWACGQTQSRSNAIENIYSIYVHTLVDGRSIGEGQGTPPIITESNIAGFTKYLFNIKTGFSGNHVHRTYMESIWSLGLSMATITSFDQSHIKFHIPQKGENAPPFQMYTDGNVSFRDCTLKYFSNCTYPAPFYFKAKNLTLEGCHLEGGIPVSDGYTNRGGERLHNVSLENNMIKCQGATAGRSWHVKPEVNTRRDIILGGEMQVTTEGDTLLNTNNTYWTEYVGEVKTQSQSGNGTLLTVTMKGQIKYGDNLFSNARLDLTEWGLSQYQYFPACGFVESVNGSEVQVSGLSAPIDLRGKSLYAVRWPTVENNKVIWRRVRK